MAKNKIQIIGQHPAAEVQAHLNETEFAEKYPDIYETVDVLTIEDTLKFE